MTDFSNLEFSDLYNYDVYRSDNYLVLDFETTYGGGKDNDPTAVNPNASVILACWWYKGQHYFQWGSELELQLLYDQINQADFFVAHKSGYELGFLMRAKAIDKRKIRVFDTKTAEYVLAGNRPLITDLDSCLKRRKVGLAKSHFVSKCIKAHVDPSLLPKKMLKHYCLIDVEGTRLLFLKQRRLLIERGLLRVFHTRCIATPVLTDIEFKGMKSDPTKTKKAYEEFLETYTQAKEALELSCGSINFDSPTQVAELLYDTLGFLELTDRKGKPQRTKKGGRRKTDEKTINALVARTKAQKEFKERFLEYRKAHTYLTKILKPLYKCALADDILHASFNQTVTKTQRLSSTGKKPYNLQFQNFPNKYKELFVPKRKGWKLGVWDYGKLEMNVASFLTQDPQGMEDTREEFDVHSYSAACMWQAALDAEKKLALDIERVMNEAYSLMPKVDKERRRLAKPDTFGPLYGKVFGTLAQMAYFEAFRKKYHVMDEVQKGWIDEVLKNKQLKTITGLIFYWNPTIRMNGTISQSTKIRNYPIQNFASAEITLIRLAVSMGSNYYSGVTDRDS